MKKWIKQHFNLDSHAMSFLLIAGVLLFICAYFLWIALDTRALQGLSGEDLAQRLFRQRTVVFISILVLYFLLLLLFWLIRNHMENRAFRLMSKQYRIIDAISSIFTTILLVDLKKDTLEVISAPAFLLDSLNSGKSAETVLDQWASQYVAEAYVKKHHEFMDRSTAQERLKEHSHTELKYQLKDGKWCQVIMIPKRRGADQEVEAVLLVTRDITSEISHELEINRQLKEAADDARRANAAKTDFLRRMSHDIRTPINGIRGMVEIGNHFANDLKKQKECRQKIWQASDFLLDLVNNVLDMNKLESGELTLEEVPFSLKTVSKEVAVIIRPQVEERGLHMSTGTLSIRHFDVLGSPLYLRQILLNLAGNAVKYNRPGGSVTLSCKELDNDGETARYFFTVADTGLGMSEDFQKHLFEPFSQENISGRSSYTGTGLGLSITKELIEKMGGSINFTSRQGEGTTFTFTLPFKIDPNAVSKEDLSALPACDLKGLKILLAEDNDLNREIADFILENEGITVVNAKDGLEAVRLFQASDIDTFDFILMDIMMPVMNGLEAAREIRAMNRPDAASIPIFAMTANAFSDDIRQSREAGMNEHLAKPLDSGQLIEKLKLYASRKQT